MKCVLIGRPSAPLNRIEQLLANIAWRIEGCNPDKGLDLAVVLKASDVVFLDAAVAEMTSLLRQIRSIAGNPIIFVFGEFSVEERTQALIAGADDFLPWAVPGDLLRARLHALMRLSADLFQTVYRFGDLKVDLEHRRVKWADQEIAISQREFQVLTLLARNAGSTISRSELLEQIWRSDTLIEANVLDVHISRLRRKLQSASQLSLIDTVRGVGYRLNPAKCCARSGDPAPMSETQPN